jgi:ubiquitin related modifier 1
MLTRSSGGLEMLFSDQKRHAISIPITDENSKPVTVAYLIDYLCKNVMKDSRKELFVLDSQMYASPS